MAGQRTVENVHRKQHEIYARRCYTEQPSDSTTVIDYWTYYCACLGVVISHYFKAKKAV